MVLSSMIMMSILGIAMQKGAEGFSLSSSASSRTFSSMPKTQSPDFSRLGASSDSAFDEATDDDDDDDDREREFARVRRRKGSGGRYADDDDGYFDDDADRFRSGGDSVMDAADMLEEEGFFDDLDDEDEDEDDYDEETDESYDVFSKTVIPNPILDSIDPDGAAERFPELAADPKFWFDMFLFINFLNFISFIGPRNPFPDVIPAMYTAGLPPPGM